ncbi:hypothetical protein AVEN_68911-1 [Araneus ventricosus]|uniref:DUF4371 domain-containing protein n=1 Tax=Araneus ventricosus TaxID=182803 RepID=A0A4Y2NHH7_ARAVE|nr:hypothetical protein AVEN_242304-1 [Araneus ventricosus]GBN38785.1 hypothetical protein AVEN_68911-1 [Araneus ventricosus]
MLDLCSGKRDLKNVWLCMYKNLGNHCRNGGKTEKNAIISTLKKMPFFIATDGSNKSDFKLYLVVTFHNEETQKIESSLLSTSALEGDSTGVNIANLILNELKSNNIPLENCLA